MTDVDFTDISMEQKGSMVPGRIKITETQIYFKSKEGKVISLDSAEIEQINWLCYGHQWGLRIFTNVGDLTRFCGFKEADRETLSKTFSNRFGKTMIDMEVSVKGWNWGTPKFKGSVLTFDVANSHGFDIPLNYVSQCTTSKNEVALEFHQSEESRDTSLMELRFYMPSSETAGETDPAEAFKEQVRSKANLDQAGGDTNTIVVLREVHCVTPRGRYDFKVYQSFFQLYGKSFDYKIPWTAVLRLFLLPHNDLRQVYFIVCVDPPIKQGKTRYPFLVALFDADDESTVELAISEQDLETKYAGKLEKEMSGSTIQVVSKIMRTLSDRKLTGPGKFLTMSLDGKQPALGCSYKANAGYLYPLERGFMFVHKPVIYIRTEEVNAVHFIRSGSGTKSFDFEIELKSGVSHTFMSIVKEAYSKVHEFISNKGIRIKGSGDSIDHQGRRDGKGEPDAYLARVQAEGEDRCDDGGDSESSDDEDFDPDAKLSDVSEESDSGSAEGDGAGSDSDGSGQGKKNQKKKTKKRQVERKKPSKDKDSGKKKREKKTKDGTKPKGGASGSGGKKGQQNTEPPKASGGGDEFKSKEFISESSGSD